MALNKAISINDPMAQIPYEDRVRMAIEQKQAQEAGMFSGNNKWLIIGGLAVAAYLAFGPKPSKTKKLSSGSGLNGPKRKKGKGKKRKNK
jgi:hypothetical protein